MSEPIWDARLRVFRQLFPWVLEEIKALAGLPPDVQLGFQATHEQNQAFNEAMDLYKQGTRSGCDKVKQIHERQAREWRELTGLPPLGNTLAWRRAAAMAGILPANLDDLPSDYVTECVTAWAMNLADDRLARAPDDPTNTAKKGGRPKVPIEDCLKLLDEFEAACMSQKDFANKKRKPESTVSNYLTKAREHRAKFGKRSNNPEP